jgi:hypothetical protein
MLRNFGHGSSEAEGERDGSSERAGLAAKPTDTGRTGSNLDDAERAEPSIEKRSSRNPPVKCHVRE